MASILWRDALVGVDIASRSVDGIGKYRRRDGKGGWEKQECRGRIEIDYGERLTHYTEIPHGLALARQRRERFVGQRSLVGPPC